jgi:SAM-dependent methyltransferase
MRAEYSAAYPALYRSHWWWRVREKVLLRTIGRMTTGMSDVRILDVGCGAGLFFDELERFGYVEGVEADRGSVERSGRWRDRIRIGHLAEDGPAFDVILLLDVLEHVAAPEQLLHVVSKRLSSRGAVLVTVPAFMSLWTSHDVLNEHLRRYTRRSLLAQIEAAGLEPRTSRYLFQSVVVPKFAARVTESVVSAEPRVPRIPHPMLNGVLQAWYRAEDRLLGWLPFGGSVLAIATRAPAASAAD